MDPVTVAADLGTASTAAKPKAELENVYGYVVNPGEIPPGLRVIMRANSLALEEMITKKSPC